MAMFQIYCVLFVFAKTTNTHNAFELTGIEFFQFILGITSQNDEAKVARPSAQLIKISERHYVSSNNQRANWFEAANICRAYNTQLANVENILEMKAISEYLVGQGRRYAFWISGNDLSRARHFVWGITGRPMTYAKWQPGDPNNNDNQEHCVSLWNLSDGFYMNDANCHSAFPFICEEKSINDASVSFRNASPVKVGVKDYIIHMEEVNWFSAAGICREHDAQLANIESPIEMSEISDYLIFKDLSHMFWLSGNDLGRENHFVWGNTGKMMAYTNWLPDDPNNFNNEEHCVALQMKKTFQMIDVNCNATLKFICVV